MSKKLASFFITIMIFINFSSSIVFSEPAVPKRMLILGDSISTGYGLEGYAENKANGYAQRLKNAFNIKDSDYLNLARDGLDSSQLLEFIKKPENKDLFKKYDSIFITIGGNDVLNRMVSEIDDFYNYLPEDLGTDIENVLDNLKKSADKMAAHLNEEKVKQGFQNQTNLFIKNFTEIISELKKLAPDSSIYVQTLFNPFSGVYGLEKVESYGDVYLEQMNNAIKNTKSITTADIYSAFKGKGLFLTNILSMDIHPNAQGHYKISTEIYNMIVPPEKTASNSIKAKKTSEKLAMSLKISVEFIEKINN